MKKIAGVVSIVFVAVVFFSGSPAVAGGDPSSAGADTFAAKCASCHAKDGSGNTTMGKKLALRDLGSAAVQKQTDQQLHDITAKGKKKMPAYEKKLSAVQINELVAYIRSLAKT
jgi:mono/diheme cytochrome c family protein